ncbi:uncharacterized protein TNCV_2227931 [Trichonephila clavipes]|nr:uncharacterized protein TNCV_2227931 [Trichonephila clavipes]
MPSDAIRENLNECTRKSTMNILKSFFALLPVRGKKAVLEWCMKEGLIGSSYQCPKCGKRTELRERMGKKVNEGFEWYCRNHSIVKADNHHVSRSVRKGSWFKLSNMDMCITHFVSDAKMVWKMPSEICSHRPGCWFTHGCRLA